MSLGGSMSVTSDVTLADLDLFEAGPPWATFDALRREDPVHWNDEPDGNKGFWSITRYHDIVDVARDRALLGVELREERAHELVARRGQ